MLFFDYITKIVIFCVSTDCSALEESWLVGGVSPVEIPDSPTEEIGVVLIPIVYEVTKPPITSIEQFTFVIIVDEF